MWKINSHSLFSSAFKCVHTEYLRLLLLSNMVLRNLELGHSKSFPGDSGVKNLPAMQGTRILSVSQEEPLEKGMATHSSILAWRRPWTEEPGGIQSMGSQRVGHDWAVNTFKICSHRWKPWDFSSIHRISKIMTQSTIHNKVRGYQNQTINISLHTTEQPFLLAVSLFTS